MTVSFSGFQIQYNAKGSQKLSTTTFVLSNELYVTIQSKPANKKGTGGVVGACIFSSSINHRSIHSIDSSIRPLRLLTLRANNTHTTPHHTTPYDDVDWSSIGDTNSGSEIKNANSDFFIESKFHSNEFF